jgi:MFS family permease
MVTYLDRVCFGSAAGSLKQALGLEKTGDLGPAFAAFAFAYAIFEIPSGWLGDMLGPRNVLIRIVLSWSLFTALTGLVGLPLGPVLLGFGSLVVIRFLFGAGEAGAYPNITRALHNWFPLQERGKAQGTVWMAGRLMGGLTPLIWWLLVEGITQTVQTPEGTETARVILPPLMSWRASFLTFGCLGVAWCVAFGLWFRNRPEENSSVNAAELNLIKAGQTAEAADHSGVPWRALLTNTNLWALCLMYFCASYGWYFNITYLPTFMKERFGVDDKSFLGAIYKGGPLWMGAVACLGGGVLTDWFIRRTGNRLWGRRLFGVVGHSLCALGYLGCLAPDTAFGFFLAVSLAAFFNDLTMGAAWATCQDIGGRYAAIVAGCMNTIGNLGGSAAGLVTGIILNTTVQASTNANGSQTADIAFGYQVNFVSYAVVYVIAAFLWLRVDATKPVAPTSRE